MAALIAAFLLVTWLSNYVSAISRVATLNYGGEAVQFTRNNPLAVIALFNSSDRRHRMKRSIFHALVQEGEDTHENEGLFFAESNSEGVYNWLSKSIPWLNPFDPQITLFKSLDNGDGDVRSSAVSFDWPSNLAGSYSKLKQWLLRESNPIIINLFFAKAMDNDDTEDTDDVKTRAMLRSQRGRAFAAFRQTRISKFIVIVNSKGKEMRKARGKKKNREINDAVSAFAELHRDTLFVFYIDVGDDSRALAMANSVLKISGLDELDENKVIEEGAPTSPVAVMVGLNATLVYDGYYEEDPLLWFMKDWIDGGSGGCTGNWELPKQLLGKNKGKHKRKKGSSKKKQGKSSPNKGGELR